MLRYILVCLSASLLVSFATAADPFDLYTNPILAKVPEAEGVKEIRKLTPEHVIDNDRILPGTFAAFLVVRTNDNRWSKLLVQSVRQKKPGDEGGTIPTLLIERYVTFKEGQERSVMASGQNICLYPGFRMNLDRGHIVPEDLGADLRFVVDGKEIYAEPLGKAKLYLLTKPLPEAKPTKVEKLIVGEKFEPRYFNGTYQVFDDGRRSGKLTLKLGEDGVVTGAYYSDKDGEKYDVRGKIGNPQHSIEWTVLFPRAEQIFKGWLFTGNAKAITGSVRQGERETGFYAVRIEEE
jgi:hypothetical protein